MEELITQCLLEEASRIYSETPKEIASAPNYWISRLMQRLGSNVPGVLAAKLIEKGVQVPE